MTTDEKLSKLIDLQLSNKEDSSFKFSNRNLNTTLLSAGLLAILSSAIFIWNNDKDQDNDIKNINSAIMQIQENQVILGRKFDAYSTEPRYTKSMHDTEMESHFNDFENLKIYVSKNTKDIQDIQKSDTDQNHKLQIFELKLNAK
jgi:hypothetical protein